MEICSNFETKVTLTAKDLSKEIESIDKLLEEKIKAQYEGKCSRNGYVLPNSVKLLSRSIGLIEKGRFTGDILYFAEAESKVLQPPDGFVLEGEVIRKNKMGMYVNYKDAIRVMIPRDLHIGDEEFDAVQVGEMVKVEIKKSRYQVNDTSILSVGVYRGKKAMGEGQGAVAREVPVAEKEAFVFATKVSPPPNAPSEEAEAADGEGEVEDDDTDASEDEEEQEKNAPPAPTAAKVAAPSAVSKKPGAPSAAAAAAPAALQGGEPIRFYSTSSTFKEFSNFYPAKFTLEGKTYPTVEHYFQAMKFPANPDYQDQIIAAKTPASAKKLGTTRVIPIRADWDTVPVGGSYEDSIREKVMKVAIEAKFKQNPALRDLLVSTKGKVLQEASPTDKYWGIGKAGNGKNRLGVLLMKLRDQLAAETGSEGDADEE